MNSMRYNWFCTGRDVADIGLEGYYNSTLTGVDGRQYGYINDDSDVEQTIIAPKDGKSIVTALTSVHSRLLRNMLMDLKRQWGPRI